MNTNSKKILLGNSLSIPEEDEVNTGEYFFKKYNTVNSDLDKDVLNDMSALFSYYFSEILNYIGNDKFKLNYLMVKNEIKKECSIKIQRRLCFAILEKINEIYNFEFPENLDLLNQDNIDDFLKFIEFLEYDNEKFILSIWTFLDTTLSLDTIKSYCANNKENIITEVEENVQTNNFSPYIKIFLLNYEKEYFIKWFIKCSIKCKSMILLNIYNSK